jgi:hypothetical protein
VPSEKHNHRAPVAQLRRKPGSSLLHCSLGAIQHQCHSVTLGGQQGRHALCVVHALGEAGQGGVCVVSYHQRAVPSSDWGQRGHPVAAYRVHRLIHVR